MFLDTTTGSPLQVGLQLIQGVTWPAFIAAAYYVGRFFYKAENKLDDFSKKLDEVHKVITNDMVHSSQESLQLLRKQDSRWEQYMITNASTAKSYHGD